MALTTRRLVSLATLVTVFALSGARAARAQDLGIPVGSKAPAAPLETLDGKPADLGAWVGKEPVFIEFWATWCPNCRQLEPQLVELQKKYAGKVRFIGVAVSVNQSPELVKRYIAAHSLQGEQLYDRKGFAGDAYEVPATSYVVVINARGVVVYTGVGGKQDLAAAIAKAF
ncbi:MAG: TlpA disulfide reductase family protein [Gemmatimonadota bacterium]|nr:TlpA disulfide reductase family protein [Gemmatimonadota bacterium]